MYYQSLMNIKENLSENEDFIIKLLKELDFWLSSMSFQRLERINPYQFSLERNYNERDVLKIFVEGVKLGLFRVKYEVRNDDNEYIGLISEKEYRGLIIEQQDLFLFDKWQGRVEEFFPHNIEIWFSVEMKPQRIPEIISMPKKEISSPIMGTDELFQSLMGR